MGSYFRSLGILWACLLVLGFGVRDALPSGVSFIHDLRSEETARVKATETYSPSFDPYVDLSMEPPIEVNPMVFDSVTTRRGHQRDLSIGELVQGAACFVTDGEIDGEYERVVLEAEADDCAYAPRPQIRRWQTAYNRRFAIRCDLAAVLNDFEYRMDEIAEEVLGTTVARIDQVGAYTCRNTYGSPVGRPSEHARANAIDISGFHLADGRMVTLANDWRADTPEGQFLMRVRNEACGFFHAVLSPDYNAAHADHFHLDLGRHDMCT